MLSDSAILKHIARQSKRQAGYKQLIRELGLHGEERRELNDHLQKLVKSGALLPIDSDRYALPQAVAMHGEASGDQIFVGCSLGKRVTGRVDCNELTALHQFLKMSLERVPFGAMQA